jgi:hypothetical protein
VAEILLRQHLNRAYWKDMNHNDERGKETKDDSTTTITSSTKQGLQEVNYYDCSRYLEQNRLTCCFEVVTAVLGDHGQTPQRDFLILTAADDNDSVDIS